MTTQTAELGQVRIEVVRGDVVEQTVDAIVNAANSSLLGGGGVDGAIHAAAGPSLLQECRGLRRTRYPAGLPVGDAVATGAGDLSCRWVIHTVGPNHRAGVRDPALLTSCYRRSLEVAEALGATSVACPAVSAGVYGWPVQSAADLAVAAVRQAAPSLTAVRMVRFVLFGPDAFDAFVTALRRQDQPTHT